MSRRLAGVKGDQRESSTAAATTKTVSASAATTPHIHTGDCVLVGFAISSGGRWNELHEDRVHAQRGLGLRDEELVARLIDGQRHPEALYMKREDVLVRSQLGDVGDVAHLTGEDHRISRVVGHELEVLESLSTARSRGPSASPLS
jgi:hypothetical protein